MFVNKLPIMNLNITCIRIGSFKQPLSEFIL